MQKLRQSRLGPDEDVRQVWQSLKAVLEELDQQCWSEDESELTAADRQEPEMALARDDVNVQSIPCPAGTTASGPTSEPGDPACERIVNDGPPSAANVCTDASPQVGQPEVEGMLPRPGQGAGHGQKLAPVLVRLGSVCEVVLQWGRSLVGSNLDCLHFLLLRLRAAARQHKMFASQLEAVSAALEAAVVQQYGSRISVKAGPLR